MITDDRYRELMALAGMSDSRSLLQALQQCAMDATLAERDACAALCERLGSDYLGEGRPASEAALLVAASEDCAAAIRNR